MKLKCQPDDFQVEELPVVEPAARGRFVFYRLTKSGLGTLEALEFIRRRWNLPAGRVSYGGLKDTHARTIQYLTILEGPEHPIRQSNLKLEPLGRLGVPYGPALFAGNRFVVVMRDMTAHDAERALHAAAQLPRDGLPNYFDDQRFGSLGESGEFIGAAWLRGDHARALYLALAEPTASDRAADRREKQILRDHWGDWSAAKANLSKSHARSLVTYLVDHPQDFRGAFARLRRDLRSIYFSAYQSHLWNMMLGGQIARWTRPDQRVDLAFKSATLPLHRGLDVDQARRLGETRIPLPSSRNPQPGGELGEVAAKVLESAGLEWNQLRVRHLKDVFLSKGSRPATFNPANFDAARGEDELYPGRVKLRLEFELPKGAYATLVVKRLTDAA